MAGRVPFGMFYVLVDPDKPFEKVLALATMAPYFLVCALTILIVRCRELLTITWLTGQLLNETANFVLKRQFKQARPDGAPKVGFDEHGMPSAHAQFMGFFLAFAVCVLLFRVRVNLLSKLSVIACTLTLTGLVCFSRIELGFHTHEQVLVGVAVGLVLGAGWFTTAAKLFFPRFRTISSSCAGRLLMLRDGASIDNVMVFEDTVYRKFYETSKDR